MVKFFTHGVEVFHVLCEGFFWGGGGDKYGLIVNKYF